MSSYKVFVQGQNDYRVNLGKSPINITVKKSKNLVEAKAYIDGLIEHSKFTFDDKLTILATMTELGTTQVIVGSSDLAILSGLSGLTNTTLLGADAEIGIDAGLNLVTSYDVASFFDIGINEAATLVTRALFGASNVLGFDTDFTITPTVYLCLVGESELGLGMEVTGVEITSNLNASDEIGIDADVNLATAFDVTPYFDIGIDEAAEFITRAMFGASDSIGIDASFAFLPTVYVNLAGESELGIDAQVSGTEITSYIEGGNVISIDGSIQFVYSIPYDAESELGIDSDIGVGIYYLFDGTNEIYILADAVNLLAQKYYGADAELSIESVFGFIKTVLADTDDSVDFTIDGQALFTRGVNFDGDSSISITGEGEFVEALPIDGSNVIGIDFDTGNPVITAGITAQGELSVDPAVSLVSEDLFEANGSTNISVGGEYVSSDLIAGTLSFSIDASANFSMALIRLRLVSDMDEFNLSEFDSMTLGELTYITIDD